MFLDEVQHVGLLEPHHGPPPLRPNPRAGDANGRQAAPVGQLVDQGQTATEDPFHVFCVEERVHHLPSEKGVILLSLLSLVSFISLVTLIPLVPLPCVSLGFPLENPL